jgi:acylphosphatase
MKRTIGIVTGKVQGVGFRDAVSDIAESMGLVGYVENCPKKTVKIVVEGEEADLKDFFEKIRNISDPFIKIRGIAITWKQSKGAFTDFEICYEGFQKEGFERIALASRYLKQISMKQDQMLLLQQETIHVIREDGDKTRVVIREDGDKTRVVIREDGDKTRVVIREDGDKTRVVIREDGDKTRVVIREDGDKTRVVICDDGDLTRTIISKDGDRTRSVIQVEGEKIRTELSSAILEDGDRTQSAIVHAVVTLTSHLDNRIDRAESSLNDIATPVQEG